MTISPKKDSSTLDLRGAAIKEVEPPAGGVPRNDARSMQPAPSIELPNQDAEYVSHIALDIGGSLIKLVYFSPDPQDNGNGSNTLRRQAGSSSRTNLSSADGSGEELSSAPSTPLAPSPTPSASSRGGRLHFVKFETGRVEDAIAFIEAKGLHRFQGKDGQGREMRVKATGGGAYKYAELFKARLGLVLEKEDEMHCLVTGCNFLLKAITHEAFRYENSTSSFVPTTEEVDRYPYLLVNIGSGVSMVKVTGEGEYERVSGSSLGGGTFWGLCHLLTGRRDFDDMLELSMQGDNSAVDMLVGDIYGGRDYTSIGLSSTTIASSFGKVISQDRPLSDYRPADISMALCRMVSYNIGQLAYLNAMRYGIKRIFFGGFFIRGHPYTMETISYAIRFWSKGEMAAMFLRHEGFLGAVGAFLLVQPNILTSITASRRPTADLPGKVRAQFVERFSMGAPFAGGEVVGPAWGDLSGKVSWVEKFVALGGAGPIGTDAGNLPDSTAAAAAAGEEHEEAAAGGRRSVEGGSLTSQSPSTSGGGSTSTAVPAAVPANVPPGTFGTGAGTPVEGSQESQSTLPLVAAAAPPPSQVGPRQGLPHQQHTQAMPTRFSSPQQQFPRERSLTAPYPPPGVHAATTSQLPFLPVQRTSTSDQPLSPAVRMSLHVGVLHYSPHNDVFPLLADPASYEPNTIAVWKEEEEMRWWLGVLEAALPTVVEKAAASDGGTEDARRRAAAFGRAFAAHCAKLRAEPSVYGAIGLSELFEMREECLREFGFSDVYRADKARENHAALCVLPDLLAELDVLQGRDRWLALIEGALAANIFDWGAVACVELYKAGTILDIYRQARARLTSRPWALDNFDQFAERVLGPEGKDGSDVSTSTSSRSVPAEATSTAGSPFRRVMMFVDNSGADIVLGQLPIARELLRCGCEVVLVANKLPAINDVTLAELQGVLDIATQHCSILRAARDRGRRRMQAYGGRVPPCSTSSTTGSRASAPGQAGHQPQQQQPHGTQPPQVPALYVLNNGQGSPCIDFRRVPDELAEACAGTDLIIIDGMGRAIHTNLYARFKCESLLLAMIKTERLAKRLFGNSGALYDCVCKYSPPYKPSDGPEEQGGQQAGQGPQA